MINSRHNAENPLDTIFGIIFGDPNFTPSKPYRISISDEFIYEVDSYRHRFTLKLINQWNVVKYESENSFLDERNKDLSLEVSEDLSTKLMKQFDNATRVGGKKYEIFIDKGEVYIYLR